MKKIITIIATVATFSASAQTGYVIKKDGTKENVYGTIHLAEASGDALMYYTKDGKKKHFMGDEIKFSAYKDKDAQNNAKQSYFLTLSYQGEKKTCLQYVIAYSDKYFITWFYEQHRHSTRFISVYDWNMNPVLQAKATSKVIGIATKSYDSDVKALVTEISPFFQDCPDVMNAFNANVTNTNYRVIFDNVYSHQCGAKSFETLIQPFLDGKIINNGMKK